MDVCLCRACAVYDITAHRPDTVMVSLRHDHILKTVNDTSVTQYRKIMTLADINTLTYLLIYLLTY